MARSSAPLSGLEPARVCIIKPSSLGDIVHASPILSALRDRWPGAHLAWVVNASFRDLLEGHPDLDELIVYDRGRRGIDAAGIGGMAGVLARLWRGRYDLTIDLQGLFRSAVLAAATRAKVRVGMADAREGARWFYTHRVDAPRLGIHAVERALRVARALGADVAEPQFHLAIPADDRRWAQQAMAALPRPRVVLNLGARWPTKRWPPQHFAAIGRRAVEEFAAGLIAVGAAEDRPLVEALARHVAPLPLLDLCGQTRLRQLAALSLEADLLLSNDTGPLHLAAAAGARVVGIYTCTSPRLTGPYGPRVATVECGIGRAPSYRKNCRLLDGTGGLAPDHVWPVVRGQLERAGAGSMEHASDRKRRSGFQLDSSDTSG